MLLGYKAAKKQANSCFICLHLKCYSDTADSLYRFFTSVHDVDQIFRPVRLAVGFSIECLHFCCCCSLHLNGWGQPCTFLSHPKHSRPSHSSRQHLMSTLSKCVCEMMRGMEYGVDRVELCDYLINEGFCCFCCCYQNDRFVLQLHFVMWLTTCVFVCCGRAVLCTSDVKYFLTSATLNYAMYDANLQILLNRYLDVYWKCFHAWTCSPTSPLVLPSTQQKKKTKMKRILTGSNVLPVWMFFCSCCFFCFHLGCVQTCVLDPIISCSSIFLKKSK